MFHNLIIELRFLMNISRCITLLTAASLIAITGTASAAKPAKKRVATARSAPAALVTTQLPRNAAPIHYRINVTPDAQNLSFKANTSIDIIVKTTSKSITLNAAELEFTKATIRSGKAKAITAKVSINAAAQTATLTFPAALKPGNYTLDMDYTGKIYQQANGLFALDYKDTKGAEKRALFTQFEAPDARRFIPSWDEPNYKATFDLTATVPTDQMAVSNMPITAQKDLGSGKTQVTFQTSPKMSTYLLFFGLGEFDRISKQAKSTEVGVIVGRGNAAKGQYALDASAKIVDYYDDYFGVPFPLPKLDNVAGPGQSQFFSAMENWGAIFTFERVLLNDPKLTSARAKQNIFATDAHEIAHQWFGNLVTMQWWDDLWLNEGFASWMESKTTQHFNPEWQVEIDRINSREAAMSEDAFVTTHPVIQKIETVEQTSQAFDNITYLKGEAVITMLEGFAGEDIWRSGIRSYIKKHAYGNTKTDDLWKAAEAAGAIGLTKIAHDFTKKPGVPLIKVVSAICQGGNTTVSLIQGEFSRDRKAQTDVKPVLWNVPVIAQTLGNAKTSAIISNGKGVMTVPGCGTLLINAAQSGYYRTLYKADQITALQKDFGKLSAIDQVGILADGVSLAIGEYQDLGNALDLLDAVPTNSSQRVLEYTARDFDSFYNLFDEDAGRQKKLAAMVDAKFSGALRKLGMVQKQEESAIDSNLRSALIAVLGRQGNAEVNAEAQRLFAELDINPAALDGPLRTTWLRLIAYNANKATWDKIRKLAQNAESSGVKATLYALLGNAKDKMIATEALKLALTSEPGKTTSAAMIAAVANEHPDLATDFALANLDAVIELVSVASQSEFIGELASESADPAMPGKLDAYAKAKLTPANRNSVDKAIVNIENRIRTRPKTRAAMAKWLDGK
jgi:aminopeptidase N